MQTKTIRAGKIRLYADVIADVFCRIEYKNGRLSITGVVGPKWNGGASGSCGQIVDTLRDPAFFPREGFGAARFADVWDRWHLNDMRAGSPSQEAYLRDNPVTAKYPESHYDKASKALADAGLNPDENGYRYGSAWLKEEVPAEVVAWLFSDSVPVTDVKPAWV